MSDSTKDIFGVSCEDFLLRGVVVKDHLPPLGSGSHAVVLQAEYLGLKCAAKKIHDVQCEESEERFTKSFLKECSFLSRKIRHPNIVQFLGIYAPGSKTSSLPILVLEYLPDNLTKCINRYGLLPEDIGTSILYDVALGLFYLHGQSPPIVHRNIYSNNILLTANMTAKISDLGMAKIICDQPSTSVLTKKPGNELFMPPEAMMNNPKYDESIDIFSFGIVMIHVLSGIWPSTQVGPNKFEGEKLIPVTEADRRENLLKEIGHDHPLMELIHKCINNNAKIRPNAKEVVANVHEESVKSPMPSRLLIEKRLEDLRIQVTRSQNDRIPKHGNLGKQVNITWTRWTDQKGIEFRGIYTLCILNKHVSLK